MACSALTMLMSVNCQHYTEPVLVPVSAERDRNHHDQPVVVILVTMSVLCVTRDIVTGRRVMLFVVTGV